MKNVFLVVALVFSIVTGVAGIPAESFAGKTPASQTVADITQGPVDINKADSATLVTLPGIGEKTAAAIVKYRNDNGKFQSLDDLQQVKGIGVSVGLGRLSGVVAWSGIIGCFFFTGQQQNPH